MSKGKLLIIEDELVIALSLVKSLERLGYEVAGMTNTGEEAIKLAREKKPELILMDIILASAMDGIEAARTIRKDADIPVIYLTANADTATVDRARDTMPYGYLNKPINDRDLLTNIDSALNKHRMEQRLRESEEKYRNLINNIQDVIVSADDQGVITYISPRISDIAGYTEEDMVGRSFLTFVHPGDHEKVIRNFGFSREGKSVSGEYRGITKSGDIIWMRTSGRPTYVNGRFSGVKIILSDITAQKLAEDKAQRTNEELIATNEELQATIEELEAVNEEFEEQNQELEKAKEDLLRQEEMLRNIVRVAPVGLGFIESRLMVWSNKTYCEMFGYGEDEIVGKSLRMFYATGEEYKKAVIEMSNQILEKGSASFEVKARRKDGSTINVHLDTAPFKKGQLDSGIVFAAMDITEQKRSEEALRESDEKYRLLMENLSDSVWVLDLATMSFVYNSPSSVNILGYTIEESRKNKISDIVTQRSLEMVGKVFSEELALDGQPGVDPERSRTIELEQIHKNGSIVWTEMTMRFLRDESGKPYGVLGVSRDITPRKYAEDLLRLQRDLARALSVTSSLDEALALCLETAIRGSQMDSGGVYLLDQVKGGVRLVCHRGLSDTFIHDVSYYSPETVSYRMVMDGKPVYAAVKEITGDLNKVAEKENLNVIAAIPIVHKGKVIADMNVSSHGRNDIPEAARTILESIAAQMGDVIIRLETQEALKRSEEKFRMIIENSPYPIGLIDNTTGAFSYFNKTLVKTLGYTLEDIPDLDAWYRAAYTDDAYRKKVSDAWAVAARDAYARGTMLKSDEVDVRCKDGTYRHVEIRMMPVENMSVFIINDLTEKKIHQEMMIQTEKMTSLGGLAAGIAHEINNPLGIILQGIQAVLNRLSPEIRKNSEEAKRFGITLETILDYLTKRDIMEYLHGIQDAGQRAAKIVSNMLQFSRRSESVVGPVDISLLIDKTLEIASNDYDLKKKYDFKRVHIIREYDPDLGMVPCSETGIEQVVLNLLKNSSQAMVTVRDSGFQPTITIRTSKESPHAVISISDNGPGIDPNIQRHIFEPFYTTKGVGMGTGLGLSVSYYIITKTHNGTIDVSSKPGEGAVFTIKLPLERQP